MRRSSPTPTPTTTARPFYPDTPTPGPTKVARATAAPRRGGKRNNGPVVAKPTPTRTPQAAGVAFTQLRGAYHVPGKGVRPVLGWRFGVPVGVNAPPALADGVVYFGSVEGAFYALDAGTGLERWTFRAGGWIQSAPEVTDDAVYFGSNNGTVYALQKTTGRLIWEEDLKAEVRGAVTVANGTLYAGTSSGSVYALDAEDGKRRWVYKSPSAVPGRPVLYGNTVIVANLDGDLIALDARTGKRRWQAREVATSPVASPALADGVVYAGSTGGTLSAVDVRTGRVRWREQVSIGPLTTPAVVNGRVLVVASYGQGSQVTSLRARDGKKGWTAKLPARTASSPAVVSGSLYVGTKDGYLYALDTRNGKRQWRFRTGNDVDASPVIAQGRAYFGSWDGHLYAVGEPRVANLTVQPVQRRNLHRDPSGDASGKQKYVDITRTGATFAQYGEVPGVVFEVELAARPPRTTKKQVAYVWALDHTLDTEIDYYVFVDLAQGAKKYRATLERSTPQGLVTMNDRLPFLIEGRTLRTFLPISPYLSTVEGQPLVEWYAYTYIEKLPSRDEASDDGRYYRLLPDR